MSFQIELDWPANESAAGFVWYFDPLPRKGEVIHDTETGKAGTVREVVWFLNERGVKHIRLVVRNKRLRGRSQT